jgi:hypothetical protein
MRHHTRRRDQLLDSHTAATGSRRAPAPPHATAAGPADAAPHDGDDPPPRIAILVPMLVNYTIGVLLGTILADWRGVDEPSAATADTAPHPWLAFMADDPDECDAPIPADAIASRCETAWSGASATTEHSGH